MSTPRAVAGIQVERQGFRLALDHKRHAELPTRLKVAQGLAERYRSKIYGAAEAFPGGWS